MNGDEAFVGDERLGRHSLQHFQALTRVDHRYRALSAALWEVEAETWMIQVVQKWKGPLNGVNEGHIERGGLAGRHLRNN